MEASVRGEIKSFIKEVAEEQGFDDFVIADVKKNLKGEGYLGEIFMITVKDTNSDRRLEVVVKAAFTEDKVRELAPIRMAFENEIYFYQSVNPAFQKLDEEYKIDDEAKLVPEILKMRIEENEEMLALENLKSQGFENFDKKKLLDHDHVELIFKTYGRLHAYSFALRDQKPKEYSKLVGKLQNVYEEFVKQGPFSEYIKEMVKLAESVLVEGEDDKVIREFRKYQGQNVNNTFHNIVVEKCEPSVILHGDCWSNNMFFKYEESGSQKKLVDIRLIDWQLIKEGSPVCDLSYCLYSGASKKIFDNINDYLRIYYDSFSSFLRKLGSDPEKLFPMATLMEHWKKYSKFGMIMALGLIRMKLTHDSSIIDLTDDFDKENMIEVFSATKYDEEEYKKRMRGLLSHMYEIDAL